MSIPTISRRNLLKQASLGAAAAALLPHLPAHAATKVVAALSWVPNVEHAGTWIAAEQGFFAAEGIDFGYLPGGPNAPDPMSVLSAGNCQFGSVGYLAFLDAVRRGNDFVIVGAVFPINPQAAMSLAARPVLKPADLVGARILGQSPTYTLMVDAMLKSANQPLDYEYILTGFSPEPLLSGDGDVYLCHATNQPITMEKMGLQRGKDFFVTMFNDLGYRTPGGLIITSREIIRNQRELVVGYLRALAKGWKLNAENPAAAAELAVRKYGVDLGLDLAQQTRQNELQIALNRLPDKDFLWFDTGIVDTELREIAIAAGQENVPPASQIVDLSMLEEALRSL